MPRKRSCRWFSRLKPCAAPEWIASISDCQANDVMNDPDPTRLIFAELQYAGHYADVHAELVAYLARHFASLKSGLQGDSHITIMDGGEEVMVDSFSSMRHQVKAWKAGPQVQNVIDVLRLEYDVLVYDTPVGEYS